MITEIGLLVALYVIARLTSGARPAIARTTAALAIVVAVLVGADLVMRGLTSASLLSRFSAEPTTGSDSQATEPAERDATVTPTGTVTQADGGSIATPLGYGIALSKGSSLKREWIAVHEPNLPVSLEGTPGIVTAYDSKEFGGDYEYHATYKLKMDADVRAVEVRFLLFNVWGEHVTNLVSGDVEDVASGTTKEYVAQWRASSDDVAEHYASIGYVARVRLADGRVMEAPIETVLDEARKFSAKFTAEQLAPKE